MYREKINEFIRIISKSNDRESLNLMQDVISSASDYVRRVNVLEIGLMVGKYNKEGAEYREYIEKLAKQRSNVHNALMTNVKIINRLCKNNDLAYIYSGNEDDRIQVAEFAQNVVEELFSTRTL